MKKFCRRCSTEKELADFTRRTDRPSGVRSECKACEKIRHKIWCIRNPEKAAAIVRLTQKKHAATVNKRIREWIQKNPKKRCAKNGYRRARKIMRTPSWADLGKIKDFYNRCPSGMEVDHIYPLNGKTVSGLHVLNNLQYLTPEQNRSKGVRYGVCL